MNFTGVFNHTLDLLNSVRTSARIFISTELLKIACVFIMRSVGHSLLRKSMRKQTQQQREARSVSSSAVWHPAKWTSRAESRSVLISLSTLHLIRTLSSSVWVTVLKSGMQQHGRLSRSLMTRMTFQRVSISKLVIYGGTCYGICP